MSHKQSIEQLLDKARSQSMGLSLGYPVHNESSMVCLARGR